MVVFKVSDGRTTRRFQMKAGEHSYAQLRDRLTTLFPEAMKSSDNQLHLHYTDSEGDRITISTDAEFQEALAQLPADATWKLHIPHYVRNKQCQVRNKENTQTQGLSERPASRRNGNLKLSLRPYCFPTQLLRSRNRFDPWNGMRRFHGNSWLCSPFPSLDSWFHNSILSTIDQEMEDMINHRDGLLDSLKQADIASHGAKDDDKSSENQDNQETTENSKVFRLTDTCVPGLTVKNFGSWEPQEYEGPFERGTIIGPVGYYVSWSSRGNKEQQNSNKEEDNTQEKRAGGEGPSQENMETGEESHSN